MSKERYEALAEAYGPDTARAIICEQEAAEAMLDALDTVAEGLDFYWHWGDGCGGYVLEELAQRVRDAGHLWPGDALMPTVSKAKKDRISRSLSRLVMERDAYRCIRCQSHLNLTCDHIIPESRGGPTTIDNLQTMCASCNSSKGTRMPEGSE